MSAILHMLFELKTPKSFFSFFCCLNQNYYIIKVVGWASDLLLGFTSIKRIKFCQGRSITRCRYGFRPGYLTWCACFLTTHPCIRTYVESSQIKYKWLFTISTSKYFSVFHFALRCHLSPFQNRTVVLELTIVTYSVTNWYLILYKWD